MQAQAVSLLVQHAQFFAGASRSRRLVNYSGKPKLVIWRALAFRPGLANESNGCCIACLKLKATRLQRRAAFLFCTFKTLKNQTMPLADAWGKAPPGKRIHQKNPALLLLPTQLPRYCRKLSSSLARRVVVLIMQSLALTRASEPPSGSL